MPAFRIVAGAILLIVSGCEKQPSATRPQISSNEIFKSLAQEIRSESDGRMRLEDVRITGTRMHSKGAFHIFNVDYVFEVALTETCYYWGTRFLKHGVPLFQTYPDRNEFTKAMDLGQKDEHFTFPGSIGFALTQSGWFPIPGNNPTEAQPPVWP